MTNSAVASGVYTIQCAAPTFNPAAGTFTHLDSVTITTSTGGATIRYTTNGTTPNATVGTVYSSAVSITATSTLQAIAYETGMADSPMTSGIYTIQCAAPSFNPAAGTFTTSTTGHHLHDHRWRDHPLYHQRHHAEFDRRHGVQQSGEHHAPPTTLQAIAYADRPVQQCRDLRDLHHPVRHPDIHSGGRHL